MELSHFAKFTIQTTSVPDEFTTSSRVYELLNAPLLSYNFERELHVSVSFCRLYEMREVAFFQDLITIFHRIANWQIRRSEKAAGISSYL